MRRHAFRQTFTATLRASGRFGLVLAVCTVSSGCGRVGSWFGRGAVTPHHCDPPPLLLQSSGLHRRYERVASLSASCQRADDCGRSLEARACELRADAVIVGPLSQEGPVPGPTIGLDGLPLGQSKRPPPSPPAAKMSLAGIAVRWTEPGTGAHGSGR